MRCGLYARFSTADQDEASIADQLRITRAYAARHNWAVVAQFVDEGISGTALGNRPGAKSAIADALAGKFEVLIVMELLRLARGEDLPPLIRRLKFRGVQVIGVQDAFDSTTRQARMQAGMASIMGGEFVDMISLRTYSALEMRAKEGRSAGGRAYGYDGQRQIIPEHAAIVREIFSRFAAGEPLLQIASDLNKRRIPSPGSTWKRKERRTDGCWLVSALHAMLRNEIYIGKLIWNRSAWVKDPDTGRRIRRERPRSQWIVCEAPELALIDRTTWTRVRARFRPPSKVRGGGKPRYLLSGILVCAICESKMIVMGGKGHRYICGTYHAGGIHACENRISVPRDLAEELILRPVARDLLSEEAVEAAVKFIRELARLDRPPSTEELDRAEAQIRDLELLLLEGRLTSAVGSAALEQAQRERTSIARRLALEPLSGVFAAEGEYRQTVRELREAIEGPNVEMAREALRSLLGVVRLSPNGRHLRANFARGCIPLLRLAGVDGLVAGAGFEPIYPPIDLVRGFRG